MNLNLCLHNAHFCLLTHDRLRKVTLDQDFATRLLSMNYVLASGRRGVVVVVVKPAVHPYTLTLSYPYTLKASCPYTLAPFNIP